MLGVMEFMEFMGLYGENGKLERRFVASFVTFLSKQQST
jgi:hypothetical protein